MTENVILKFNDQIESICKFAVKGNYKIETTEDFDYLMKSWFEHVSDLHNEFEANRDEVIEVLKSLLNNL